MTIIASACSWQLQSTSVRIAVHHKKINGDLWYLWELMGRWRIRFFLFGTSMYFHTSFRLSIDLTWHKFSLCLIHNSIVHSKKTFIVISYQNHSMRYHLIKIFFYSLFWFVFSLGFRDFLLLFKVGFKADLTPWLISHVKLWFSIIKHPNWIVM